MTGPHLIVSSEARSDLDRHVLWLRSQVDSDTAARFARAVDQSIVKVGSMPGLGSPIDTAREELVGLRKWRVDGFPNMLIFYQPVGEDIRIVRVLHAAQDWLTYLNDE